MSGAGIGFWGPEKERKLGLTGPGERETDRNEGQSEPNFWMVVGWLYIVENKMFNAVSTGREIGFACCRARTAGAAGSREQWARGCSLVLRFLLLKVMEPVRGSRVRMAWRFLRALSQGRKGKFTQEYGKVLKRLG